MTRVAEPHLPDPIDFLQGGLELSLFKIRNIFLPTGAAQKQWINDYISNASDHKVTQRIASIQEQHQDVGDYLWSSGRCAIAHAGEAPTVDPENPSDIRRLGEDLPLAQASAELAIEEHFGVKSAATVYREHLYELEGFHELFHEPRVARTKTLSKIGPGDWPVLPRLSIRLAFHDPYAPRSTTREAHE